jgi:hypothetical protein
MEINADEINAAKEAGFTNEEIKNNFADEINAVKAAGFSDQEIDKQYGFEPVDKSLFKNLFETVKKRVEERRTIKETAKTAVQTAVVGPKFDGDYILEQILGANFYNLSYRATTGKGTPEALKMPKPEDYTFAEEFLTTAGTLALEAPIYIASAFPGTFAGVLGGPMGAAAGGGFTAAAIPTATRTTLVKVLENQDNKKPSDVMQILLEEGLKEGVKEGGKFAVSMLAPFAKIPGIGTLSEKYITRTAAQILGYQGTGIAIDRELPDMREFGMTSALFALFNIRLPKNIATEKAKETFIETGKRPTEFAMDAKKNRIVLEDAYSENIKVSRAYKDLIEPKKEIKEVKAKEVETINFEDPLAEKAAKPISFEGIKEPFDWNVTKEQFAELRKKGKRDFVIKIIDRKYPVLETLRDAGVNTKTGIEKLNLYETLRIQEGMQGRSAHFIEYGTLDFNTLSQNGPSLMSITKPFVLERTEQKLFSTYLLNKQAIDLMNRGKDTPFDMATAKEFVEKYKNKKVTDPETGKKISYEEGSQKVNTYQQDGVLKYAYDGGLVPKEAFDAFREINKNYISMATELPRQGEYGFIKGASNPFRKLKGQKIYKIIDPLESIVKNTDYIVRLTDLNKIKNDWINFIKEQKETAKLNNQPDPFPFIKQKEAKLKSIKIQRKELENIFDKEDVAKISDKGIEAITIFRQEAVYPDAKSFSLRNTKTGKYEVYEVGEDLVTAFRVMDNPAMSFLQKWLSAPSRTLRTGAIVTPNFALPNFLKDTVQATFLAKVPWVTVGDSIYGLFYLKNRGDPKRATEEYKRYLKGGGAFSTLRSIDRTMFDKDVHSILNKGVMRNEQSGILAPFKILTDVSEVMTRVRLNEKVYQAAKKKGLTEREALERAGFEARNLLDYAKAGTIGATINRYSAFWNARAQGATVIYEAFRDRPAKALTMIGLTIVLPTIAFYLSNLDENGELDKDYKELPDYVKNNKYYVKINGKGYFFPKTFEVGTFFSNLTENVLNYLRNEDRDSFMEFAKDFLYSHVKGYNPIPVLFKPHLENLMNYSFFRDAPLLPADAPKDMLNSYYSTDYTNPTIKKLSENLAEIVGVDNYFANPIYLENIYDSYFGDIGRIAKEGINEIAITGGVIEDPIKPTDPLTKIPGIRAFQAKDVYGYSKSVNEFFKKTDEQKKLLSTVDYLLKTNNTQGYLKEIKNVNFDVKAVLDILAGMKETSKDIRIIYNAKKKQDGTLFTSDEKKDLIEDLYKLRIGLAQKGLQIMKSVEQKNK